MTTKNGAVLDPTQDVTATTTVQRVLYFDAAQAPYLDANKLYATMREGGYDVLTVTRANDGDVAVTFGWNKGE